MLPYSRRRLSPSQQSAEKRVGDGSSLPMDQCASARPAVSREARRGAGGSKLMALSAGGHDIFHREKRERTGMFSLSGGIGRKFSQNLGVKLEK